MTQHHQPSSVGVSMGSGSGVASGRQSPSVALSDAFASTTAGVPPGQSNPGGAPSHVMSSAAMAAIAFHGPAASNLPYVNLHPNLNEHTSNTATDYASRQQKPTGRKTGSESKSQPKSTVKYPFMHDRFDDDVVELAAESDAHMDRTTKSLEKGANYADIQGDVQSRVIRSPEVIDDFIRNFLFAKGMQKTLETFHSEWYDLMDKGKLAPEDLTTVPDVYQKNQELCDVIERLRKQILEEAQSTFEKLRKDRDFHRLHHKRMMQEKAKMSNEAKQNAQELNKHDELLKEYQARLDAALKNQTLLRIERDRLLGERANGAGEQRSAGSKPSSPSPTRQKLPAIGSAKSPTRAPTASTVRSQRSPVKSATSYK